jgi:sarcosine oxidase
MTRKTFDFVVIGAGCFGAWTAHELLRAGHSVLLLDAYGPAHSRASSGGESRVIRMGYGADELYTRWSQRSLAAWKVLAECTQRPLFREAGMLWLVGAGGGYVEETQRTLSRVGVEHERLSVATLADRFPQISTDGIAWALWEPGSGVLMARQSIQALVAEDVRAGLDYRTAAIASLESAAMAASACGGKLDRIVTSDGEAISAGTFVFACGAWLPKVFPTLLGTRIFPTRQEIFFFAPPAGDPSFAVMPAWFHHPALVYGIPDLEHRGFKISIDKHGAAIDPDTEDRIPSAEGLAAARAYLAQRFPKLRDAPLAESRVCQYENTSNGDFIIDRHPDNDNVFIVGGGSGHGFKHGPAVGEYAARLTMVGVGDEPRFALASKASVQRRGVF